MIDLALIRQRLAARAATLDGLRALSHEPDNPAVGPGGTLLIAEPDGDELVTYHLTGDGLARVLLIARLLVGSVAEESAVRRLDAYRSRGMAGSLADALEGDPALGGAVSDVTVLSASPLKVYLYHDGQVRYHGFEMMVEVLV